MNQVGDYFGIGLGVEHITQLLQLIAQRDVVFYDPVVDQTQIACSRGSTRSMGVCIFFINLAVRCPPGVGDSSASRQWLFS